MKVHVRIIELFEQYRCSLSSEDVAHELNLSIKAASAHLSQLLDDGVLVEAGRVKVNPRGPLYNMYELKGAA